MLKISQYFCVLSFLLHLYFFIVSKWDNVAPFRGFVLACFRKLGIGTLRFEERIINKETSCLIEELANLKGKPVDLTWYLNNVMFNIIYQVVFGNRFELSDDRIHRFFDLLNRHNELLDPVRIATLVPLNIPGKKKLSLKDLAKSAGEILDFINNMIEDHRKTFDPDNLNNFIDTWLNEIRFHKSDDPRLYLNLDNMPGSIFAFFLAATYNSSNALRWGSQYLVRYPEIQDRVHREIDDVVGRNRLPTFSDRLNLPYTQAVLTEIQRVASVSSMQSHVATDITTFRGYTIPKNTMVIANSYGVMHSLEVWNDPEAFQPERFLDGKGNFHEQAEVIPFGMGEFDYTVVPKISGTLCINQSKLKFHLEP